MWNCQMKNEKWKFENFCVRSHVISYRKILRSNGQIDHSFPRRIHIQFGAWLNRWKKMKMWKCSTLLPPIRPPLSDYHRCDELRATFVVGMNICTVRSKLQLASWKENTVSFARFIRSTHYANSWRKIEIKTVEVNEKMKNENKKKKKKKEKSQYFKPCFTL